MTSIGSMIAESIYTEYKWRTGKPGFDGFQGTNPSASYTLELELYKTKPDKESTTSEPIWMVFNLNWAEVEHEAAEEWVVVQYGTNGDVNGDGRIDLLDFSILAAWWMSEGCGCENNWCDGVDINRTHQVDLEDLRNLVQYWVEG